MTASRLHELAAAGQSVWIDDLSRDLVRSGKLERLFREGVVGVTSNPTIFEKALADGAAYADALRSARGDAKDVFVALAAADVRDACDVLRGAFDAPTGRGKHRDGCVSIEVDPRYAYDTVATAEEAARLHALIDRPNLLVKIPATMAGLPAIEDMIAKGKSINVTLIFSLRRYAEVARAYIRGLERLVADGGDATRVQSVASFFVSRVDTEADSRLSEIGGHDALKGKLAVANAKLAYRAYREIFSGEQWEFLEAKGASSQRCLWASTSTKNPAYSDVMYVDELIGPETVNTLPEATIRAFQDHGRVAATLERDVDAAEAVFDDIAAAGVDYDDVTAVLEKEGVQKFTDSFLALLDTIERARAEPARRGAAG